MELKWSDDDIRQLREAVNHLLEINEELNAKVIAMDAYVKNGDAKIRAAQRYINQLEQRQQLIKIKYIFKNHPFHKVY